MEEKIQSVDHMDAGLCGGFAYGAGRVYQDLQLSVPELAICIPPEVNPFQLLKVFVNFLVSHPEKLHEDELLLVTQAYREAWPCSDK